MTEIFHSLQTENSLLGYKGKEQVLPQAHGMVTFKQQLTHFATYTTSNGELTCEQALRLHSVYKFCLTTAECL